MVQRSQNEEDIAGEGQVRVSGDERGVERPHPPFRSLFDSHPAREEGVLEALCVRRRPRKLCCTHTVRDSQRVSQLASQFNGKAWQGGPARNLFAKSSLRPSAGQTQRCRWQVRNALFTG